MLKESETIELKESIAELDKGIASITAMLNKRGKCELYLGACDNGTPKGHDVSAQTMRNIRDKIQAHIEPRIYPIIEEIVLDGKTCIVIIADGKTPPYSAKGKYYLRVGESDEKMSQNTLRQYMCNQEVIMQRQTHTFDEKKARIYEFFAGDNYDKWFAMQTLSEFFVVYDDFDVIKALTELYQEGKLICKIFDVERFGDNQFCRPFPTAKPCINFLRL